MGWNYINVDVEIEVEDLLKEIGLKKIVKDIQDFEEFDLNNPECMNVVLDLIKKVQELDLDDNVEFSSDVYTSEFMGELDEDELKEEMETRGFKVFDDSYVEESVIQVGSWIQEQIYERVENLIDNRNNFELWQDISKIPGSSFGSVNNENQTSLF